MVKTTSEIKGYVFAALAAAAYGTNPAFAIPLYEDGMNPNSVLLLRYVLGLPILALVLKSRGFSFRIDKFSLGQSAILGILMAFSSLSLFDSYQYMNSGIASTLLFVYPIMVAVIMIFFFHEKLNYSIFVCLIIMAAGLIFLMKSNQDASLSYLGCLLVFISALTYALYIVLVNISSNIKKIPTTKLLFYVLLWGSCVFAIIIHFGNPFTLPVKPLNWINIFALAIIPTILSLSLTTMAIQIIGSTPTAILGALEPVTAVILSVFFLHQGLTANEIIGGILIIIATVIVISSQTVDNFLLHVRKMFPRRNKKSDG